MKRTVKKFAAMTLATVLVAQPMGQTEAAVVKKTDKNKPAVEGYVKEKTYGNAYEDELSKDTDGDGIVDYLEDVINTDKDSKDTDKDGLTDYDEWYVLETDPLSADTDKDGIRDSKEDADKDGLNNAYELKIGTSPIKKDTDKDGLPDGKEVKKYGTDPLMSDTDGDSIYDGDEIILGLNPMKAKTNGKTDDSKRTFDQKLAKESVESTLLEKGNVKPSIKGNVSGYINRHVSLKEDDIPALEANSAIVGKQVAVSTDYSTKLTLSFDCKAVKDKKDYLIICRYEDSKIVPLDTTVNKNTISTTVSEGTYFVVDSKEMLANLGVTAQDYVKDNNDKAARKAVRKAKIATGQADVVFVVDNKEAITDNVDDFDNNVSDFVDELKNNYNVQVNVSVLDDNDVVSDAIAEAGESEFRQNADKYVVVLADSAYKKDSEEKKQVNKNIKKLDSKDIATTVITDKDIDGDINSTLSDVAQEIGDNVNDGNWVILSDYQYLNLEEPVSAGHSSDDDGVSDKQELGKKEKVDLTPFVEPVLKASGVPVQMYDNSASVMMYSYSSNPVLLDTDYDGIYDNADPAPNNNSFAGKMYYSEGKKNCNVEFNVDYRQLFNDNTAYNDDLAILSSLYASDIYDGLYISVNQGTSGGSDNATTFGTLFGLSDVTDLKINASDYTYDKDDVTEAVIGHRTVNYNGQDREIVVLSIRGTNSTVEEWSSNFDVGADTSNYYSMTGQHPEWTHKNNHKGFDIAANRVLTKVNQYLANHNINQAANKSILITGHSRGAGIANIIGAHFERNTTFKSYTYTFASPYTTTVSDATSYSTIMNIMNTDDIIPYLPLEAWGFKKYGKMFKVSVEDKYENSWGAAEEGTFEWLIGSDYNNDGGTQRTLNAFAKIGANRQQLYVIDSSSDGKVNLHNKYHTTTSGANKELEQIRNELAQHRLAKFCNLYVNSGFLGIKEVVVNYCPAYLMQNIANMAAGDGPILGFDVRGKYAEAKASFVASSGKLGIGGMEHPHLQPTYYLIAHNKFQNIY